MIKYFLLIGCFFISLDLRAQSKNPDYDAELAGKVGADDYGMKHYVIAFLKTGPTHIADQAESEKLQMAHLQNILKLANDGKLIVSGPFLDKGDIRGIFIFNVATVEEAKKLTDSDPAVKAGVLIVELHPWYGSAGLVEAFKIHKKVEKIGVAD